MGNLAEQRWIALLVLAVFLAGCSSTRMPILPGEADIPAEKANEYHVLTVSDEVVVELQDGTKLRGRVVEVSRELIVVGQTDNFGYSETRVEAESIERIEWVDGGSVWPFVIVLSVGAVVLYVAAMAGTLSNMN